MKMKEFPMSRKRIATSNDSAAVLLPQELLDQLNISAGDEVDLVVIDRTLILRPLDEAERALRIEDVTSSVLDRRTSAYQELAKGVD
jgi:antitoxin component of MazEF toxin-antitoxin module